MTTYALWAALLIIQNFSFTIVSRARNSPSILYHGVASLFSNAIWFASQFVMVGELYKVFQEGDIVKAIPLGIFYTVFTMTGSLSSHYACLRWFEKKKEIKRMSLTYLATPYTHSDPSVMEQRFQTVSRVAGQLMQRGEIIFSPITHCHPIQQLHDLPREWEFWKKFDTVYLQASKKLIVLTLDGWKESVGVQAEIKIAEELGIPVEYYEI